MNLEAVSDDHLLQVLKLFMAKLPAVFSRKYRGLTVLFAPLEGSIEMLNVARSKFGGLRDAHSLALMNPVLFRFIQADG